MVCEISQTEKGKYLYRIKLKKKKTETWVFPGSPVVKDPLPVQVTSSIAGQGTKVPHAREKTEPTASAEAQSANTC